MVTTGIPKQMAYNSLKVREYFYMTKTSKQSLQFSVIVILMVGLKLSVKPDVSTVLWIMLLLGWFDRLSLKLSGSFFRFINCFLLFYYSLPTLLFLRLLYPFTFVSPDSDFFYFCSLALLFYFFSFPLSLLPFPA